MSQPIFPVDPGSMTREDVINQIISSIAMEELGLSHILNAEGEKLQYVLGTLPGVPGPNATVADVLATNDSIKDLLAATANNQQALSDKLAAALGAAIMQGPTGATGATGPAGGPAGPTGPTGAFIIGKQSPCKNAALLNRA